MNNIVLVNLESTYASAYGIWQWDYGQILRIQSKKKLPKAVEVHFSEQEKGGSSITRIGTTADNVTDVPIPDSLLEKSGNIYAFVYIEDGQSGNTEYKIEMSVKARPKPEIPGSPEEPELFKETIKAVNEAADRADTAEQNANDSASKAEEAAASASASAKAAENTKTEALEEIGNKKQDALSSIQAKKEESLSAIRTQEENSVSKVTEHTNEEIQRFQNVANESKGALDRSIEEAGEKKTSLDSSIQTADSSKANLDESVESAGTAKSGLDASTGKAKDAKTELDGSIQTAGEKQTALDTTVGKAEELATSLAENIETGTQLQKDLVASGEKAVQDIQSAGSEQLDKMQTVADEFEADREQVNTNKENIAALTDDMEMVKDTKITKFYANNQGENHLADSDKGKIQDMMVYGKSEQFTTSGKNLLKYPYAETTVTKNGITFTDNKDGSIKIAGTATTTVYFDLYKNKDGYRLTLASGTYKLIAKGGNKFKISLNNGVNATGNMGTITITDGHNEAWCYIEVPNNTTIDETIYPMIQLASIADETYEPYTGGIPSPNPDYPQEIKSVVNPVVKVVGKNVYNFGRHKGDYAFSGSSATAKVSENGSITIKGSATDYASANIGEFLVDFPDGEYYMNTPKNNNVILQIIGGDGANFQSNTNDTIKFVKGKKAALYVVLLVAGTYNLTFTPMICKKREDLSTNDPYTEQLVQLPYTLNAIPVSSGGNVTIDGQQYVADYVDVERGKLVRNIYKYIFTGSEKWSIASDNAQYIENFHNVIGRHIENSLENAYCLCSCLLAGSTRRVRKGTKGVSTQATYNTSRVWVSPDVEVDKLIDESAFLVLKNPEEIDLTFEQVQAFKALSANYPVTNISVASDQLDGYTVFNYPISMKNGWDYVKQQLNDNRDYIYDMDAKTQDIDTQAAEAYVNSEYAVALTELEVM